MVSTQKVGNCDLVQDKQLSLEIGAAMFAAPLFLLLVTQLVGLPIGFERLQSIVFVVSAIVVYPVLEEIVFRGILLYKLTTFHAFRFNFAGVTAANAMSSLLFALLHSYIFSDVLALFVFFPSLIFGYFYEKTKSLKVSITLHMFYNAHAIVLPAFW